MCLLILLRRDVRNFAIKHDEALIKSPMTFPIAIIQ